MRAAVALRRRARAALARSRRLRGRQRVTGVVDSIEAYVRDELGDPARFELLRPAEAIERPPARTTGAAHSLFETKLRRHTHPAAFRARLPGAQLAGLEPLALTPDRRAFLQSTYDREQLDANATMRKRLHPARRLSGPHMLLHNQWGSTHFHWMLDTLPRLALLPVDAEPATPILIPAGLSAAGRRALELAGVPAERTVAFDGTRVAVDEMVFPSFVGSTGNPPAWAMAWLRDRVAPAAGAAGAGAAGGRRLFVSRADATWRGVANEDEVVRALAGRGFERLVLSDLTLDEQLAAFAGAEAVVAPHGAGLVNLIAARDAKLLELFAESYVNGCYYALSAALGLPYSYLVVPGAGRWDLQVEVAALLRAVDALGLD
jgi:capsular polysaccharide biosynthesis protein